MEALDRNRKITLTAVFVIIAVLLVSTVVAMKILNPDVVDYTVQAQKIFDQAKGEVEQIRNVTFTNQITLHVITKQDAVDRWGKPSAPADLTNIYRQEKIYKGLFLMPENDSLYQATSDWTANWGAATVGKNDIYVIKENFDPWDKNAEATFVHELTHVWQPQLPMPTTFDEDKAHTALVEGDASFMGDYYINKTKTQSNAAMAEVDSVPIFLLGNPSINAVYPMANTLWELNFFPYDQGKTFVSALYQQAGFATINQAYKVGYVPDTTAQILHSEKYFANETAQPIQAATPTDNTWTLVQTDRGQNHNTYGEFFIQVMLSNWLPKTEAQNASAGWTGDNFTYFERGNDYLFTWNIKWDSNCDASNFYVTFHNMVNATGTVGDGSCNWFANGRYLTISWNQNTNSTLIAVSTVQNTTQQAYFSLPS